MTVQTPRPIHLEFPMSWWEGVLARVQTSTALAGNPSPWLPDLSDGRVQSVEERLLQLGMLGNVVEIDLEKGEDVWFVGDVHGDLLGLEAALTLIRMRADPGTRVILLGDLIDDGFHAAEVIHRVIDLVLDEPELAIAMIAGNHDEAFGFDVERGLFTSRVHPGDFALWLNTQPGLHDLGRAFIHFVSILPRAIFFRHGLLAAHAGFPHSDSWSRIVEGAGPPCMYEGDMLRDFTWNRLSEAARKIPNRSSLGATFGSEDFHGFCRKASAALGHDVTMMVRGHDHVSDHIDRFSRPTQSRHWAYHEQVLTINNMSFTLPRETGLDFGKIGLARHPTLACWRSEEPPTPIVLVVPPDILARYVTTCEVCGHARPISSPCRANHGMEVTDA